jgi:hypothetical protein
MATEKKLTLWIRQGYDPGSRNATKFTPMTHKINTYIK